MTLAIMLAMVIAPTANAAKPTSTWQTYNIITNILTVLVGGQGSAIYHRGTPEDYDGGATKQQPSPFIPGMSIGNPPVELED